MRIIRAILFGGCLSILLASSANAQVSLTELQEKLAGTWLATVADGGRPRMLIIDTVAQKPDGSYLVVGTYTFVGDRPAAFKDAQIQQSSGTITLIFSTGSGSVYTLTTTSDGSLTGTTKYKSGQVFSATMVKGAMPVAAATTTDPAAAASTFLKKDELEKLVMGKDVLLRSKSNGNEILWAIKSDGNLYGVNRTIQGTDTATWQIRDDGALCVEWRGASNNSCSFFNRQGDKYTLHRSKKNPATMDVISIK